MATPMHHEFLLALWPQMERICPLPWRAEPNPRERGTVTVVDSRGKRVQVMGPRHAEHFINFTNGRQARLYMQFVDSYLICICCRIKQAEGTKDLSDWRAEDCQVISAKGEKIAELSSPWRARKLLELARGINALYLT